MKSKKAQIQITFNWIYILIAGTLILLFFVGIVFKQKAISEDRLTVEVIQILDEIFIGASVSEKTKHFIDASGLAEYTLSFSCDEGVSDFGIKGSAARAQNVITPIFSLKEMISPKLILWSLPYKLPFKVIDFLFVISSNTKYILVGDESEFKDEFLKSTEDDNLELSIKTGEVRSFNEEISEKGLIDIRIVDLDGSLNDGARIPDGLKDLSEKQISAVSFDVGGVFYYTVKNGLWKRTSLNPAPIISIAVERDAAKYAAIFAADDKMYRCNMQKAFQRLDYLTEIYSAKTDSLIDYYKSGLAVREGECLAPLELAQINVKQELTLLGSRAKVCHRAPESNCDLESFAGNLERLNEELQDEGCVTLY